MILSQVKLRELLHYDPETGVWTWLNPLPRSRVKPGDIAGRIMDNGRRQIRIASGFYYSSRLAWLYMTSEWPINQVDHENRNRSDDRWENLREATQSQNSFNRDWCEGNGSLRGLQPHGNKWRVDIGGMYLGLFEDVRDAEAIRDLALWYRAGRFATLAKGGSV